VNAAGKSLSIDFKTQWIAGRLFCTQVGVRTDMPKGMAAWLCCNESAAGLLDRNGRVEYIDNMVRSGQYEMVKVLLGKNNPSLSDTTANKACRTAKTGKQNGPPS